MKIKINKKVLISKKKPPIIIAEISGNHCGKKSLFLKHIKIAAKSGADMIKIQTYEPKDITVNKRDKNFIIKKGKWKGKKLWDIYKKVHTPFSWHKDAFRLAKKLNIILFSTPFSIRAFNFLKKFDPPLYKISSFEITDFNLINHVAKTKKPIIISTGMANEKEIKKAISIISKYHKKIIVLHCVSGYPIKDTDANISTIKKLQLKFKNFNIGLSDHTKDINSSLAASALGATVIEKHFKISEKVKSIDSDFSINPNQLQTLKNRSLKIFETLGNPKIGITDAEKGSLIYRRSIFASRRIEKGERLSKNNIITYRPKIGICASKFFYILGKKAKKTIKAHSPIFKKMISK